MTTQLTPLPVFRAWDNNGVPLAGGLLFTYIAGTTTKQATFTDSTGGTQNTNPVVLNYRGEAQVWLDPTKVYKLVLAPSTDTDPPTNPFWTADQINGGSASPSFNVIPTVDNLYTLGSTTFSWANVYVGPNHAPVLDSGSGNIGYYKQTATEISQPVTPSFFSYPVSPKVDPRRYGAVGDGVADDTAAMQMALNIANANHGRLIIPDNFNASCGALALTFSGTRATNGLSIEGMSINGSRITQRGTPAALLTFTGATPAGAPTECLLVMENFTINQATNAKTADGIVFNNLASIRLSNVLSRGFTQALHLKSSLIINIDQGCQFTDSNFGILIESNGVGGSTCNLIVIEESRINLNSTWGVWFENGDQLHLRSNDLEGNGTAGNLNSGGIRIRGNLAPVALVAGVLLERNWIEGNLGTGILVDSPTGGVVTDIQIIGGNVLAQELNAGTRNSITVNGATRLAIENLQCVTPNDTWALTCNQGFLKNTIASVLSDGGITTPTYINVNEGGRGLMAAGRRDTATLTLTGVTGTVTQVVTIIQQGDIIRVLFADFLATSTTTSCTITGLPIKYSPSVTRFFTGAVEDNTVDSAQTIAVAAGGTITLFKNGVAAGFTAAGTKGLRACDLTWRL